MKRTIEELKLQVIEKLTDTPGSISVADIKGLFDDTIDSLNRDEFIEFIETFKFSDANYTSFDLITFQVGSGINKCIKGKAILITGTNIGDTEFSIAWGLLSKLKQSEIEINCLFLSTNKFKFSFGFMDNGTFISIDCGNTSTLSKFLLVQSAGIKKEYDTGVLYGDDTTWNTLKISIDENLIPHFYVNNIEYVLPNAEPCITDLQPYFYIQSEEAASVQMQANYFRAKWLK